MFRFLISYFVYYYMYLFHRFYQADFTKRVESSPNKSVRIFVYLSNHMKRKFPLTTFFLHLIGSLKCDYIGLETFSKSAFVRIICHPQDDQGLFMEESCQNESQPIRFQLSLAKSSDNSEAMVFIGCYALLYCCSSYTLIFNYSAYKNTCNYSIRVFEKYYIYIYINNLYHQCTESFLDVLLIAVSANEIVAPSSVVAGRTLLWLSLFN